MLQLKTNKELPNFTRPTDHNFERSKIHLSSLATGRLWLGTSRDSASLCSGGATFGYEGLFVSLIMQERGAAYLVDVGQDTTTSDSSTNKQVKLLVSTNSEL